MCAPRPDLLGSEYTTKYELLLIGLTSREFSLFMLFSQNRTSWIQYAFNLNLESQSLAVIIAAIAIAVVYHPHWSNFENNLMRDHLLQSLRIAESNYPNCALIVASDFNRLDGTSIKRQLICIKLLKGNKKRRNRRFSSS